MIIFNFLLFLLLLNMIKIKLFVLPVSIIFCRMVSSLGLCIFCAMQAGRDGVSTRCTTVMRCSLDLLGWGRRSQGAKQSSTGPPSWWERPVGCCFLETSQDSVVVLLSRAISPGASSGKSQANIWMDVNLEKWAFLSRLPLHSQGKLSF